MTQPANMRLVTEAALAVFGGTVNEKNTAQDAAIASAKTDAIADATTKYGGLPGRVTAVEAKNTAQDTRLTAIETKNTTQDTAITGKLDKAIFLGRHLGASEHLDNVKNVERFYVDTDAKASLELGFPIAKGGYGENRKWNDAGTILIQTWHPFRYEGYFYRFFYSNTPYVSGGPGSGWMEFQTKTAIAALLAGKADASAIPQARSSTTNLVCAGDSLTDGYSSGAYWDVADSYPAKLAAYLGAGVTVTKRGFVGATTDQINTRMGAAPIEMKIPGGSIPASGTIIVTSKQVIGAWGGDISFNAYGYLDGIYGLLEYTEASGYTFRRSGTGAAVTATRATFIGEHKQHATDTIIYGAGRNDITKNTTGMEATVPDHVIRGYSEIMAYATPRRKQVVLLGTITRTDEFPGDPGFEAVQEIATRARALWPAEFADLQGYLTGSQVWADTGIAPTPADLDAQALGMTPPSLFDDTTHYSRATAAAIGGPFLGSYVEQKGFV